MSAIESSEEILRLWAAITSGRVSYETYANLLVAVGRPLGSIAEVYGDNGTHEDPVTQTIVANTGVYRLVPEGWERYSDLPLTVESVQLAIEAAAAEKVNAQLAAAAAKAAVGLDGYATTGAALAATADGDVFYVSNGDGTANAYRHDPGPSATLLGKFIQEITADTASMLIGHKQAGAGNTPTTVGAVLRRFVCVLDYGNPFVDVGDSLQKAHNALGADGGEIWLPPVNNYPILTTAAFTKPITLRGSGLRHSEILCQTADLVCITTTNWFCFEKLEFTSIGPAANTAVPIKQLAASAGHGGSVIQHCRFSGGKYNVWLERANTIHVLDNEFGLYAIAGLYAQNKTNTDEGDSFISRNVFAGGSQETAVGALLTNAGWNIEGNKGNGPNAYIFDLFADEGHIGNFMFIGGSFEGYIKAAVRMRSNPNPADGNRPYINTKVHFTACQMSSNGAGHGEYGIDIGPGAQNVSVAGGNINNQEDGTQGVGIRVQSGAKNITIGGGLHLYGLLTAIQGPAGDNVGLDLGDIRYGKNITNIYSGEHGSLATPANDVHSSSKRIRLNRYIHAESDVDWVNVWKWKGQGRAKVCITGLLQGAGEVFRRFEQNFLTPSVGAVQNNEALGHALEAQIVAVGGEEVLQVRRGATGTALDIYVSLELEGYPTDVVRG